MYKYKLTEEVSNKEQFQQERINSFDTLESRLDNIKKLLRQGKLHTIRYYRENPDSWSVIIGTDLIGEYLNDIEILLKQNED
jgi:hypothetical protein